VVRIKFTARSAAKKPSRKLVSHLNPHVRVLWKRSGLPAATIVTDSHNKQVDHLHIYPYAALAIARHLAVDTPHRARYAAKDDAGDPHRWATPEPTNPDEIASHDY
jgi:hypothetical protein